MSETPARIDFRGNTRNIPPNIPLALQRATGRFVGNRAARVAEMPEWEALRNAAHDLRLWGVEHLDELIEQTRQSVTRAGGEVHFARDSEHARQIILDLARARGVKTIVKSKSMATEEIALNPALEKIGVRTLETDLGEYIIQLAGVMPAHIIAPAIYLTKEGIADLFAQKLGVAAPPEPRALIQVANERLRAEFLHAEMGISGADFVVAETGTVVLVTNEGNGRMCTTLPDIHVAVSGIDKLSRTGMR
ncbi:MAG: lactate utilization protein [Chloroflexi bacterium]|nr:lactate utilization protein [Chloroflexota bacterium]